MGVPSSSIWGAQVCCCRHTPASSLLSTEVVLLSLRSLIVFYCLVPFWGATSPSSNSWPGLFFFKLGLASNPRSVVRGRRGGRIVGVWILGTSFEVPPLFLLDIRPFRLDLFFRSLPSISSDLESIRVITDFGKWAEESLSDSVLESESSTGFSSAISSSLKRNWSISSSNDKRKEPISFSTTAVASGGTCCSGIASGWGIWWTGSMVGGRSSRAKKSDFHRSIRFIRGSPTLMAWPTSWKIFEMGSNSRIKWTARNYRSLLTKISKWSR